MHSAFNVRIVLPLQAAAGKEEKKEEEVFHCKEFTEQIKLK